MKTAQLATATIVAVVGLNLLSGLACSQNYCPYGVYPFSGATSVPTSAEVIFYASGELPRDLPELERAFVFVNDGNEEPVDFSLEIDPAGATFTLRPSQPLERGATYRVTGVHAGFYQGGGTWWSPSDDQTTTRFTVGQGPATPLDIAYDADNQEVIVGFSEPVDPQDWRVTVPLPAKPNTPESEREIAQLEAVGSWNNDAGLQRFVLTEGDATMLFAEDQLITVTERDNPSAEAFTAWVDGFTAPVDKLAALLSLPHCSRW